MCRVSPVTPAFKSSGKAGRRGKSSQAIHGVRKPRPRAGFSLWDIPTAAVHRGTNRLRARALNPDSAAMSRVVTLSEIKAAEAARRREAVTALKVDLAAYARTHGGRFLLFGSAARGTMRYDSDVDILVEIAKDAPVGVFEYVDITQYLSDLFPQAVDVANRDQLKAHVRLEAERDAIYAF